MEMCYRGISHYYLSTRVETADTQTRAQFLGKTYKVRRPIYDPNQEKLNLVYRGVAYSTEDSTITTPQSRKRPTFIKKMISELGI